MGRTHDTPAVDEQEEARRRKRKFVKTSRAVVQSRSVAECRAMCAVALRLACPQPKMAPVSTDSAAVNELPTTVKQALAFWPRDDESPSRPVGEKYFPRTKQFIESLIGQNSEADSLRVKPSLIRRATEAHGIRWSDATRLRKYQNHDYQPCYGHTVEEPASLAPVDHLILLKSLDPEHKLTADQHAVLSRLSRCRGPWSQETHWRHLNGPPTQDELDGLLSEVADLTWPDPPPGDVSSAAMLSMAQEFARAIRGTPALDSRSYRSMCWDSLDSVVWRELLRSKAQAAFPDQPLPQPVSARELLLDVWLIAEYGYTVLGLERDFAIHRHFVLAMRHEQMLYHGKDGYRDHLRHSVNVFLLGYAMMTADLGPFPMPADKEARNRRLRDWLLASLFHDFGYVMELVPAILAFTERFDSRSVKVITDALEKKWKRKVGTLNKSVRGKLKLKTDLEDRCDHGLFSYTHLRSIMLSMDRGREADPEKVEVKHSATCKKHRWALEAILHHNIAREPLRMQGPSGNPLDGVLVICDEIQDWDRPRYEKSALSASGVSLTHFGSARASSRQTTDRVEVSFGTRGGGLTEVTVHFSNQNRNMFDPIARLIGAIHNWERIGDISGLPLLVHFRIRNLGRGSGKGSGPWSEISILREFCLIAEAGSLSSELFDPRSEADCIHRRCTHYVSSTETGYVDVVCINFAKFPDEPRTNNPLIRRPPWKIKPGLQAFKRDYCRKHGIPCEYLAGDDDWAVSHTLPPG